MPQPPFLVDQLQLEPGSGQTLTIARDAATGALKFVDAVTTGGILLHQLAGLQAVTAVSVVGKAGSGAQYTTIQAALDAIPSNASPTNPYLVLVTPGDYSENVTIVRDGVQLIAVGEVVLHSATDATPNTNPANTLTVKADQGTVPHRCHIRGFRITNTHNNYACIKLEGAAASQVGDKGIFIEDCVLETNSAGGNRHIQAASVNHVYVKGGSWEGSTTLGLTLVEECVLFYADGLRSIYNVQLDFDDQADLPSDGVTTPTYRLSNCPSVASGTLNPPASIHLVHAGTANAELSACRLKGALTVAGDQTLNVVGCELAGLTLNDTAKAKLFGSRRTTVNTNANAKLDEPVKFGTQALAAAATVDVTFAIPMSDATYRVELELPSRPANDESPWITNKATTGFRINFNSNQTMTVSWTATRA